MGVKKHGTAVLQVSIYLAAELVSFLAKPIDPSTLQMCLVYHMSLAQPQAKISAKHTAINLHSSASGCARED